MGSNPWLYILIMILAFAGGIAILSLLSSLLIAVASARHAANVTKSATQQIEALLPGTHCGECGCKTCKEYACLVLNREEVATCPYCTEEVCRELESITDKFWAQTEDTEQKLPNGWRKFGS